MKFKYVGIGAGGNKSAVELVEMGVCESKDVVLVNSTDKDFPKDKSYVTCIISPDNTGCGKEYNLSANYATECCNKGIPNSWIDDSITNVVFITSVEGGTGSGATPVFAKYMLDKGLNVHVCSFIGFGEDVRGLENTIKFYRAISKLSVDNQVIDMRSLLERANGNKFIAEAYADKCLVEKLRILRGDNLIPTEQNIDDTDLHKLVSTTGYKIVEERKFDKNLLDLEQFNKLCRSMIYESHSLQSSGHIRLGVILNIKPESENAIDKSFTAIKEAYGLHPYETYIHKQYDGGHQYIQFISSGMKFPIEEIEKMYKKYKYESSKMDKSLDSFADAMDDMELDDDNTMFDMYNGIKRK